LTQVESFPSRRPRRAIGQVPPRATTAASGHPAHPARPASPPSAGPYRPPAYPPAGPHQPAAQYPPAGPPQPAAQYPPAPPYPPAAQYPAAPYPPAGPQQQPAARQRPAAPYPPGAPQQERAGQRPAAPYPPADPHQQQAGQRPAAQYSQAPHQQAAQQPAPPYRPAPGYQPPSDPIGIEFERRGSHATLYGQGFAWVLSWTILGALIPGSGLIAAGWRRLGGVLIGLLGLVFVTLAFLAVSGKLQEQSLSLAFDSGKLFAMAVAAPAIGLIWIAVILLTNTQLSRHANLDSGQRTFSALVVLALIVAVVLPAYQVGNYAMITRSVVTSHSVFAGDSDKASGPNTAKADPWADKPQVNVLLIGSDAGKGREGIRPDTLILASVNTKTGKTVMFSLPRSLQHAPFPEGSGGARAWPNGYYCPEAGPGNECMINAIWRWAEGDGKQYYSKFKNPGLKATEDAVQGVTGLKVDTYVMLNLNGFRDFVDALDGVTVDIHERLPIGGNSKNPVAVGGYLEKGNNQHLDGYHALWFARSRWSTSDYSRMQRQRCVIGAVVDQADPLKVARNFPDLAKALKKNLATGIDSSDLSAWVTLAQRVQKGGVTSIVFDPEVINTVNPDIDEIHRLVSVAVKSTAKVKKTATSTSTPTASTPTPSATAKTKPPKTTVRATPGKAQSLKSVC
jgi:LCP family protein required for cell wall assembly